eukprot:TRINITY_DN1169_c0_g1_i1.p1 TRINITY_DN1169_c0_g1~~TRINITY_DN1169_c0_g1_i1.p1  ORF type:complete len:323 (-),score=82.59 TRINITY_DN1169_c0_g1_i1:89-1057(-)
MQLSAIPGDEQSSVQYWIEGVDAWRKYFHKQNNNVNARPERVIEEVIPIEENVHHSREPQRRPFSRVIANDTSDMKSVLERKNLEIAQKDDRIRELERQLELAEARIGKNEVERSRYSNVNKSKREQRFWRVIREDDPDGLHEYLSQGDNENLRTKSMDISLIHFVAEHGCVRVFDQLMQEGARVDQLDSQGHTPLYYAINKGSGEESIIMVGRLLNAGANVNHGDMSDNRFTPLHSACLLGNYEIVRSLLRAGADLNKVDGRLGWTCLHWAATGRNPRIVQLLLEQGVPIQKVDKVSPVDVAVAEEAEAVVRVFKAWKKRK